MKVAGKPNILACPVPHYHSVSAGFVVKDLVHVCPTLCMSSLCLAHQKANRDEHSTPCENMYLIKS